MTSLLVRHLFESTLLCVLLGGLACCIRRQGAAVRHGIWLIGISKFAIPSALFAATGAQIALLLPASAWVSSLALKFSAVLDAVVRMFSLNLVRVDMPGARNALITVWLLFAAGFFLKWINQLRNSHRILATPLEEERQALDRARRRLGMGTPVSLRCSENSVEPSLVGLLHPIVTVPKDLSKRLPPAEFETVLLHELAHAIRRDNLAAAFVHFLVCIFWFHPLLWLVERRLMVERERACDEMVIASGAAPQVYAAGILKVCRFHLFEPVAGVSAVTGSDLPSRVELILSCQPRRPRRYSRNVLLGALALLMALLPMANGYCEQCVSNGQSSMAYKSIHNRNN